MRELGGSNNVCWWWFCCRCRRWCCCGCCSCCCCPCDTCGCCAGRCVGFGFSRGKLISGFAFDFCDLLLLNWTGSWSGPDEDEVEEWPDIRSGLSRVARNRSDACSVLFRRAWEQVSSANRIVARTAAAIPASVFGALLTLERTPEEALVAGNLRALRRDGDNLADTNTWFSSSSATDNWLGSDEGGHPCSSTSPDRWDFFLARPMCRSETDPMASEEITFGVSDLLNW